MTGLFYKEIKQIVSNKLMFLVIFGFLLMLVLTILDNSVLTSLPIIAVIVAMLSLNTQYEDEKNSFESFGLSCPLSHKEFVLPKYILMWIASLLIFSFSIGILSLFSDESSSRIITIAFTLLFIQTLLPCFLFPLSYKFGSQKARIAFAFIFFATVFLLIPALKHFVLKSESLTAYILNIEKNFYSLKYILIMSLAIILMNAISFFSSVLIVKNKEY